MLLCVIGVTSCNSQNRSDLLAMKFNQPISDLINTNKLKESQDIIYGIYSYETDQLDGFRLGDVNLSTYKYPKSAAADYNNIEVYVDNRTAKQYLGFRYTTVKQEEIKQLIEYFKRKYPTYAERKDSGGEAYFWDLSSLNAWLFYYPSISIDGNGEKFLNSNFLFVKKGTRMENSQDTTYNTILDNFNMMYPKN